MVWAAELAVFGGVGGTLAPLSALLAWLASGAPSVGFDLWLVAVSGLICAVLGGVYGAAAARLSRGVAGVGYPLLPLGFPLGSVAGVLAAACTMQLMFTPRVLREVFTEGLWLGGGVAGLVLGVVWAPWILMHRRGRPRWPVILLASLAVPVVGIAAMLAPVLMIWAT